MLNERQVSLDKAMLLLGLANIAYIKPVHEPKGDGFAVHAADGTQLAVLPTREAAIHAALQNNFEPMSLH